MRRLLLSMAVLGVVGVIPGKGYGQDLVGVTLCGKSIGLGVRPAGYAPTGFAPTGFAPVGYAPVGGVATGLSFCGHHHATGFGFAPTGFAAPTGFTMVPTGTGCTGTAPTGFMTVPTGFTTVPVGTGTGCTGGTGAPTGFTMVPTGYTMVPSGNGPAPTGTNIDLNNLPPIGPKTGPGTTTTTNEDIRNILRILYRANRGNADVIRGIPDPDAPPKVTPKVPDTRGSLDRRSPEMQAVSAEIDRLLLKQKPALADGR
jgi:hypothetical protein